MAGLTATEKTYIAKRDKKIADLARQGYWAANIGERFGLSAHVVRRVIAAHGIGHARMSA